MTLRDAGLVQDLVSSILLGWAQPFEVNKTGTSPESCEDGRPQVGHPNTRQKLDVFTLYTTT